MLSIHVSELAQSVYERPGKWVPRLGPGHGRGCRAEAEDSDPIDLADRLGTGGARYREDTEDEVADESAPVHHWAIRCCTARDRIFPTHSASAASRAERRAHPTAPLPPHRLRTSASLAQGPSPGVAVADQAGQFLARPELCPHVIFMVDRADRARPSTCSSWVSIES